MPLLVSRRLLPTLVYADAIRTYLVDDTTQKTSVRGELTFVAKALMDTFCTHAMDFIRKSLDPAIKDLKPFDSRSVSCGSLNGSHTGTLARI